MSKHHKQKQKMSFKSLVSSVFGGPGSGSSSGSGSGARGGGGGGSGSARMEELFVKTEAATDGDECLRDCESCSVRYPRGFKVEKDDALYGRVKGWSTHVLVGTGKADWVRDVEDEKGSVMEAFGRAERPSNGRLMLSASNMPTPGDATDYSEPTSILLLPAFTLVHSVQPSNVPQLITSIINHAPTTSSPLCPLSSFSSSSSIPASLPSSSSSSSPPSSSSLTTASCPHSAVILMCSQKTRDARCGQSAPLLRKEFERHLRPLGLYRDLHDERPGGVGIYFISHVGGHKYSANVMVYRRPNAFGQDDEPLPDHVLEAKAAEDDDDDEEEEEEEEGQDAEKTEKTEKAEKAGKGAVGDVGAAQCIWLGRVMPEDCENLIRYTVLKGKVVKPESQLRGGFDRAKGLISW